MAFKLHMIKTVLRYMSESWPNSGFIIKQSPATPRIKAYFSLLYWYFIYGNDFNDYCSFQFWNKTHEERKSYISFRRNDRLRFALSNPRVYKLFLDKAEFNNRFSQYIHRKWMIAKKHSNEEIFDFITTTLNKDYKIGGIIAKPINDYGGHGIKKLDSTFLIKSTLLQELKDKNYILEEYIVNCNHLKRLAPGSLNTIRIVTLLDKDNKMHILAACLRMGNGKAFTDNYHDGGMACAINISTGTLKGKAFGMGCVEYEHHPHSGIRFDGYEIPEFRECLKMVENLVNVEPEARYVGWDLAITPNGIELLEGNIPPGEDITQIAAGRGLWNDVNQLI